MKTLLLLLLFTFSGMVLALPQFNQQNFGPGMGDPGFQGFGDPASPFGNPMGRGMESGFGHQAGPGPASGLYNSNQQGMGSAYELPRSYGGYGAGGNDASYDPRARYGGMDPGMNSLNGLNTMGGMSGMGGMPGMPGGGMGGMGMSMGDPGMGFMGDSGFMDGAGGRSDGMDDMFKMQAEMQQLQKQMMQGPPPGMVAKDSSNPNNSSSNVVKVGDNIIATNMTRFNDNNDGLTQGFFQEFRIFPGMESTTSTSSSSSESGSGQVRKDSK